MSALTDIQDILSSSIGDGRSRLTCLVNSKPSTSKNVMMLFYVDVPAPPIALGTFTQIGYYVQEIEFGVRHADYNKSREIAFQALKLLGVNRRNNQVSLFFDEAPTYKGIDDTGGHNWGFNFKMRGKQ